MVQPGRGDNARSSPSRRRHHGHTNGSSHGEEAGEEGQEGGSRSIYAGTGDAVKEERDRSEPHLTTYDPAAERVVDWKTEFQQNGIRA